MYHPEPEDKDSERNEQDSHVPNRVENIDLQSTFQNIANDLSDTKETSNDQDSSK